MVRGDPVDLRSEPAGPPWIPALPDAAALANPNGGIHREASSPVRRWTWSLFAGLEAIVPWAIGAAAITSVVQLLRGQRTAARLWAAWAAAAFGVRWVSLQRLENRASHGSADGEAVAPGTRQRVRLATANLWASTADVAPIAEELVRMEPDVLVLQEVTPRHLRRLGELGVFDQYPNNVVMPDRGSGGLGVWSRWELADVEWFNEADELQVRGWVVLPLGGRFRLIGVHAPAPVPSKADRWRSWFSGMARECAREIASHDRPVIFAGDFNATVDHRRLRLLLRAGLRDAGLAKRKGWRMTWTFKGGWLPALFRIDHVLVSQGASVEAYEVGHGVGSDHRPVFVELMVGRRE